MPLTTPEADAAWRPDEATFAAADAIPKALVLETSTVAGFVDGDAPKVRVAWVDDADAGFVPEGDEIPEAVPDLAEAVIATGKIAQLLAPSNELFGQPGASNALADSVERAVTKAANFAYIQQPDPGVIDQTPPTGILNQGIVALATPVADTLDPLVDLQATLAEAGGNPTHMVVSPTAWASLRKIKRATGSAESLLGVGADDAQRVLLDLPVLVSSAVPAGTGLIVDKAAIVSAVGDVKIARSEHAYFAADRMGLRCTFRFGAKVVHPDRVGSFTVAAPA
ncbi:phage major capsid protein [Nocardioides sp. NPDC059952]|uniref:phage major capsid protein n=1 Tax=Nocardioides sp. NPDC059952 TaxID=3347014 RepID=UPI00364906EE